MKTLTQSRPKLILTVLILSTLLFSACRITLVANYDEKISEQIDNVSKSVDRFYLTMLETTTEADNGRAYSKFTEQYVNIEVELQSLLNKNKVRTKNEETVKICESTIEMFEKYKTEHKTSNTISDANIKLNLAYFRSMLNTLLLSEYAKKLAE